MKTSAFTRVTCWLLTLAMVGCSSMQAYRGEQINADLPIMMGDRVKIYEKGGGRQFEMIVSEVSAETIKGPLVENPDITTTVSWDEIDQVDIRQFDTAKTGGIVILVVFLLKVLADVTEETAESIVCGISGDSADGCDDGE
jgi:hypothetical protein